MDVMQRRRATPEELQQGMAQMQAAQERLSKEATEEAIEDVPGSQGEVAVGKDPKSQGEVAVGKDPKLEDAKEFLDVRSPEAIEPQRNLVQSTSEEQKGEKSIPKIEDSQGSMHPPRPPRGTSVHSPAAQSPKPAASAAQRPGGEESSGKGRGSRMGDKKEQDLGHGDPVLQHGDPHMYTPGRELGPDRSHMTTPLFSAQQLRELEELHSRAPWLYRLTPGVQRPVWLDEEERRHRLLQEERTRDEERAQQHRRDMQIEEVRKRIRSLEEENLRFEEENLRLRMEREKLQQALAQRKGSSYGTPEEKDVAEVASKEAETTKEEAQTPREAQGERSKKDQSESEDGGKREEGEMRSEPQKGGGDEFKLQAAMMQGMVKLMEGMQEMQAQILDVKRQKDVEIVKSAVVDLPKLPEWKADTAPLDLADWLLVVEPGLSDLSDNSQQWWEEMLASVKQWYAEHQERNPLERVNHKPQVPLPLQDPRFQRLEKRVTALLMSAIPPTQQEEVVAAKEVNTVGILSRLMLCYQPGGLSEKGAILSALDSPEEAQTLAGAVTGLRRWLRWHRRAGEVGVTRPDATLQIKGLGRLMKRVLKDNPDLAFRIQLSRSSLQVDTAPTEGSVMTFANHLLAEVEQIAHQDKRKKEDVKSGTDTKLKRLEESSGSSKGEGKSWKGGGSQSSTPCKFFQSDEGCKKGKQCTWSHVLEGDKRRCWNCGSTSHLAPSCDRPKEPLRDSAENQKAGEGKGFHRPSGKALKKGEEQQKREGSASEVAKEESVTSTETMKGLLEEANRMLKGLAVRSDEIEAKTKDERLTAMQGQLDELRRLKVLRLSRIEEGSYGLLDSGATNPMRGKRKGEDLSHLEEVQVTLANGSQVAMRMTSSGVMVVEDEWVEPIVPLGLLTSKLGYTATWRKGRMTLSHPTAGKVDVCMKSGCPQVSRLDALKMIKDLEEAEDPKLRASKVNQEEAWLWELLEAHPVLKKLPDTIKRRLVVKPAEDLKGIPDANRRRRKVMTSQGFLVHLYAGESAGYSLSRAFKEVGGDGRRLVEIDVKREDSEKHKKGAHDMLDDENGPYSSLLRGALDGSLLGIVMGPNCRTRSVLRHYPLDIPGGGPRPLRSWDQPWGKSGNTPEEQRKVEEDDVLLWRGLMLFVIREEVRKALQNDRISVTRLGLEQPADPTHYVPEVVTFWKTEEWRLLSRLYGLHAQSFRQSAWGGKAVKPTTFAGNISLKLPEGEETVGLEDHAERAQVKNSAELSRWAPGMMKEVAMRIQTDVFQSRLKLAKMSWAEHLERGHTPFRRDCRVCQEASARGRMHTKVVHPRAGVMNLDVSGPYKKGRDTDGDAKFLLVGTYTWLRPPDEVEELEVDEDPVLEVQEDEDQWPEIEDTEAAPEEEEQVDKEDEEQEEQQAEQQQAAEEPPNSPKIEVMRIGIPIKGKTQEAVLSGFIELYLQLKVDGFPVHTVHTDRGREFVNRRFKSWLRCRGIVHSTNGGEDPMANGRAERAVGEVKRRIRRILHGSEMAVHWWPMALRYMMESARLRRKKEGIKIPQFGEKLLVKTRNWRTKAFQPTHEVARYLTPAIEAHGHCVLREDGRWGVAPYVVRNVQEPPPPKEEMWLAIAEEVDRDEVQERRRIREKRPIRDGGLEGLLGIRRMIQEEAQSVEMDQLENAMLTFRKLDPWKKMMRKAEVAEQEILQTKIVSPQELVKDVNLWDEAIKAELDALLNAKEALRKITTKEKGKLEEKFPDLLVVPSKLVITRKAGGRRKVRIVACGNYVEKTEKEDVFASGSDSISFRIALKKSLDEGWKGATADIKTAFLNAPLGPSMEALEGLWKKEELEEIGKELVVVVIKPPALLVKLGYVSPDEWWIAVKAVYGLRQSPKAWGDHRDAKMSMMEWGCQGGIRALVQSTTDPNVWKIVKRSSGFEEETEGLCVVYVDDLMVLSQGHIVEECLERVSREWEISTPEWLNEVKPIKFLGMEVWMGTESAFISQESYVLDLLRRNGEEDGHKSGIPITKDQVLKLEENDHTKTPEDVKAAQRVTGELMWLVTRSRPDLMFALSKMSQATLKNPKEVLSVARQVWKYLRKTKSEGLEMKAGAKDLEVYTDSSYGPGGLDSQGTVLVLWGKSPIMWKSGKQGAPALSTAESELAEGIDGMVMGDSVDVLVSELSSDTYGKVIKIDNTAAVSLMTESAGSWRTRHLRLRASHLRWRIGRLDWVVEAISGQVQIADIGTKALTAPRLEELKEMMGMKQKKQRKEETELEQKVTSSGEEEKMQHAGGEGHLVSADLEKILRMVILLGCAHQVNAQEDEEDDDMSSTIQLIVLTVLAMIGLSAVIRWMVSFVIPEQKSLAAEEEENLEKRVKEALSTASSQRGAKQGPELAQGRADPAQKGDSQCGQGLEKREERQLQPPKQKAASSALSSSSSQLSQMAPPPVSKSAPLPSQASSSTQIPKTVGAPQPKFNSEGQNTNVSSWTPGNERGQRALRGGIRSPIFVTPWGTCYHEFTSCPTLANTKRFVPSQWCDVCAPLGKTGDKPIYTDGPGSKAHYDSNCTAMIGSGKKYQKCQRCVDAK